jgi:hypothetical protein
MKNTSVKRASKSKSYGYQNEQEGTQKKSNGLLQSDTQNNGVETELKQCSDISTSSVELEDLPWLPSNLGEYRQPSLWKSTPMRETSCDRISQEFQFTQTSETTTQSQENSICYQSDFLVQAQATQELEQDYLTQSQHFGEKELDVLSRLNPVSVLSNNLKELSNEDFELFLADSLWQDTITRLKQSRQQSLGRVIKDEGFLLFPTLTSNENSTSRPAGQTKCEKWFKDNGLIPNGSQLSAQAIASLMNFPTDWFSPLSPVKLQEESEPDILQVEPSPQPKQRSPWVESSICIPCLVKQPGQPEVKGVIKQDLGDRFSVDVDGEEISISKLFVYPDFSKTVGQIPPSKNSPSKTRRKKGDGTGYIYRRTITRRGKEYQESYFRYRDESGKLRSKYIPQRLLDKVQEAESLKKPIAEILVLLGGDEISRGEQSTPPSNRKRPKGLLKDTAPHIAPRRKQGDGTGYIECKPIKRSGKEYQQYWYHYEEWREGDRIIKKSRYIPKRLLARVEKLEAEKAPVREILEVLGMKG